MDLEEVKTKAFAEGVIGTLCNLEGAIDKVKAREKTIGDLEKQVDELRLRAETTLSMINHGKLLKILYINLDIEP